MLILTRRINESLVIGDDVTVTILGVKGNQVRIGVDAPRDVSVHREELAHKDDKTPTSRADRARIKTSDSRQANIQSAPCPHIIS